MMFLLLNSVVLISSGHALTFDGHAINEKDTPTIKVAAVRSLPRIEEIRHAWQERENGVHSARFVWDEQRVMSKRYVLGYVIGHHLDYEVTEGVVADVPGVSLSFSGTNKIRYETEPAGSGIGKRTFPHSISTFDGVESRSYVPPSHHSPRGIDGGGMGTITVNRYSDIGIFGIRPILLVYRPLHGEMLNLNLNEYTVDPSSMEIRGRPCAVITNRPVVRVSGVTRTIWLDLDRDFLPLRYRLSRDQRILVQSDIEYRYEYDIGWILDSWENTIFESDGSVSKTTRATVVHAGINEVIAQEHFRIEYPPRTRVWDYGTGERYYVMSDGRVEPLVDWGADFPEQESLWPRLLWQWVAVCFVVLGILGFLIRGKKWWKHKYDKT